MLPGIFIVLFFFALGELVGWLVNGFIPGSVIGMMLLFTALCLKWVKPERIKPVARFLCDNMALFFVPAGVGIVNALDILSQYWQAVLSVSYTHLDVYKRQPKDIRTNSRFKARATDFPREVLPTPGGP